MNLSFPQTDEPYYFPVLEFWNWEILNGSNPVIKGPEVALKAQIRLYFAIWAFRAASGIYLTWFEPLKYRKLKIQAQENNKVYLFEEMTKASVLSE